MCASDEIIAIGNICDYGSFTRLCLKYEPLYRFNNEEIIIAMKRSQKLIFQRRTRSLWICRIIGVILSIAITTVAHARAFDMNLSNDTAELRYITPVGFENSFGSAELDVGFLSSTSDDIMGIFGFQAVDEAGSATPGVKVGVGIKGFVGTINDNDVYAVALGGNVHIPVYNRFSIFGDAHFAPDVVTFGDADRLLYLNVRLEYQILPQATVYIGYRKLQVNLKEGGNESVDNGANIGLQFLF
jgi:YfaZ precursor